MPSRSTKEHALRRFERVHGDRYDYHLVEYVNSGTYVKVICREHGVFETTPDNHYKGNGCPECSKKNLGKANRLQMDVIKERLSTTQGLRYIYLLDAYELGSRLKYLCPSHGWRTQSIHHLLTVGCSLCRKEISQARKVMRKRPHATFEAIKERVICDTETGRLYERKSYLGRVGGEEMTYWSDRHGYLMVSIDSRSIPVHRVVMAFVLGRMPKEGSVCDHINGVVADNRAVNLREVSRKENQRNCKLHADSTTKVTGVNYCKRNGKYRARIGFDGKSITLGSFESIAAAAKVRKKANEVVGFHPNHGLTPEERAKTT